MKVDSAGKFLEIIRIFGNDDSVFCDGTREHDMVGVPQSGTVAKMDGVVLSFVEVTT